MFIRASPLRDLRCLLFIIPVLLTYWSVHARGFPSADLVLARSLALPAVGLVMEASVRVRPYMSPYVLVAAWV